MAHDDTAAPASPLAGAGQGHPSRQTLARLLSGTAQPDELQLAVLPHLAACCPACRAAVEDLADLAQEYGHWDLSEAITEWREAPRLGRRLAALPAHRQLAAIDADDEHWTWGLARHLQLQSAGHLRADPAGAAHLAVLALAVARHLGESYDLTWVRGLRALCLAGLGNARRELGEIHAAADALTAARQLLDAGAGSPAFEAEVLLIAGLVARDRHHLAEALGLFAAAQALLAPPDGGAADPGLLAAALAHQAWCRYHQGDPAAARERLEEAARWAGQARRTDPDRDPDLPWEIALGRLGCALALGDLVAARAALARAEELAAAAAEETPAAVAEETAGVAAEETPEVAAEGPAGEEAEAATKATGLHAAAKPAGATAATGAPLAAGLPGTARRAAARRALLQRPRARLAAATGERQRAVEMLVPAVGRLAADGLGVEAALALLEAVGLLTASGAEPSVVERVIAVIPDLVAAAPADLQAADLAALLALERDRARRPPPLAAETLQDLAVAIERRRRPGLGQWSAWPRLFAPPNPAGGENPALQAAPPLAE